MKTKLYIILEQYNTKDTMLCELCNQEIPDDLIEEHLDKCTNFDHICEYCSGVFSIITIDKHKKDCWYKNETVINDIIKCQKCNIEINKNNEEEHYKKCFSFPTNVCKFCHDEISEDGWDICDECVNIKFRQSEQSNDTVACDICKEQIDVKLYFKHISECQEQYFVCKYCSTYVKNIDFSTHECDKSVEFQCTDCETILTKEEYKTHECKNKTVCHDCGMILLISYKDHHMHYDCNGRDLPDNEDIKCDTCDNVFNHKVFCDHANVCTYTSKSKEYISCPECFILICNTYLAYHMKKYCGFNDNC